MARRGGRGGAGRGVSFDLETLGFGRGEALPAATVEPPPTFPPLNFKPSPLIENEEKNYLLALKQEFRSNWQESPYYIKTPEKRKDIQRYSDKYQLSQNDKELVLDWTRFPKELRSRATKRKSKVSTKLLVKLKPSVAGEDVSKQLEELEKKDTDEKAETEGGDEEENEEDEDEVEEEEEIDDEEDENDYNVEYFDNGENFGLDDDDDLEDGPVY